MLTEFAPCYPDRPDVYPVLRKTDGSLRRNGTIPRPRHKVRSVLSKPALLCRCEVSTSPAGKVLNGRNRAAECTPLVCRNVSDKPCPGAWLRSRSLSRSATFRYKRSSPQRKVLFARVLRTDTSGTDWLEWTGLRPVICRSYCRMMWAWKRQ